MPQSKLSLQDQLLRECDAMAKHAFASGLMVPPLVVQKLQLHLNDQADVENRRRGATTTKLADPDDGTKVADLAIIHGALAAIVAPATPRTILLLAEESQARRLLSIFGPVPLVRHMMVAAVISLVTLIGITLSSEVNDENLREGLTQLNGYPLLVVELLYVSAAAMGACFAALFTANRYVVMGTFDPKYRASYWVRFILGILAGVILADFVPLDETAQSSIQKPLLAILGGFSASLVYQILSRLVDTVESVFRGDAREQNAAQELTNRVQADAKAAQLNATVAKRLLSLHRDLGPGSDPKIIADRIDQVVNELIPSELSLQSKSPSSELSDAKPDDKKTDASKPTA